MQILRPKENDYTRGRHCMYPRRELWSFSLKILVFVHDHKSSMIMNRVNAVVLHGCRPHIDEVWAKWWSMSKSGVIGLCQRSSCMPCGLESTVIFCIYDYMNSSMAMHHIIFYFVIVVVGPRVAKYVLLMSERRWSRVKTASNASFPRVPVAPRANVSMLTTSLCMKFGIDVYAVEVTITQRRSVAIYTYAASLSSNDTICWARTKGVVSDRVQGTHASTSMMWTRLARRSYSQHAYNDGCFTSFRWRRRLIERRYKVWSTDDAILLCILRVAYVLNLIDQSKALILGILELYALACNWCAEMWCEVTLYVPGRSVFCENSELWRKEESTPDPRGEATFSTALQGFSNSQENNSRLVAESTRRMYALAMFSRSPKQF